MTNPFGTRMPRIACGVLGLIFIGASAIHTASPQSTSTVLGSGVDREQALMNRYCLGCHSAKLRTGGLALEGLDIAHVAGHADTWEKVLRKVRTGEMPPRSLPRSMTA